MLGKFASEVLEMPQSEMQGWIAYLSHKNRIKQNG
jgi:hypothetical protein